MHFAIRSKASGPGLIESASSNPLLCIRRRFGTCFSNIGDGHVEFLKHAKSMFLSDGFTDAQVRLDFTSHVGNSIKENYLK